MARSRAGVAIAAALARCAGAARAMPLVAAGACATLGPGVDREDPAAVCLAHELEDDGLALGDTLTSCAPASLRITPLPAEDCAGLAAYRVEGCRAETGGEPVVETRWVEMLGERCVVLEHVAGICFE